MDGTAEFGPFSDRFAAGRQLAAALRDFTGADAVVLGLARGGVEVGAAVAEALHLPLRALVIRKVGAPRNPELAVGAVSGTGVRWIDRRLMKPTGASPRYLHGAIAAEVAEAQRRHEMYGSDDLRAATRGKVAILVDDGIATGASALVAVRSARDLGAARVVLATPVASAEAAAALERVADEVVVLVTPEPFRAVGLHYSKFDQLDDQAVLERLREARERTASWVPSTVRIERCDVRILSGAVSLPAILSVPPHASGIVIFAHGTGSGRHSPRNAFVAGVLDAGGLSTLLADLLTEDEARDRHTVFDVELLAARLQACVAFAQEDARTASLSCGLFGASTGAGAALVAAADPSSAVRAVVSRGGRPDLAGRTLERVRCPTLLLVGAADTGVVRLNQHAFDRLHAVKELALIPGATHLFEEPGTLAEVAQRARDWFQRYLPA